MASCSIILVCFGGLHEYSGGQVLQKMICAYIDPQDRRMYGLIQMQVATGEREHAYLGVLSPGKDLLVSLSQNGIYLPLSHLLVLSKLLGLTMCEFLVSSGSTKM